MIVDAHTHIMREIRGTRRGEVPTTGAGLGRVQVGDDLEVWMPPSFERSVATAEMLVRYLDWLQIDGAVLLQAPCYGDQLPYLREVVRSYPGRFVTVALVDPRDSRRASVHVETVAAYPEVVGVKFEVPDTPFLMDAPEHAPLWRRIVEADLLATIDLGWHDGPFDGHVDRLSAVLERYSTLQVVVAHLGVSRLWDRNQLAPFPVLRQTLRRLSGFPGVVFDIAGLPFFCPEEEYPYPRAQEIISVAVELVGPDRLMWGSDFPTVLQHCTYRQVLDLVRNHVALDRESLALLLGRTAERVYRFDRVRANLHSV
ncbi:MAG TPA: amidohydrolase family protein [bacterium]|nr:amidohydrolase family protein [bacterium]